MLEAIFKITEEKQEKDYGRFSIEPLPQGFGSTIGNTLRRIVLTSLKGAAISRVKIKGVKHQFSTIPGLKEDVVDLILNLKKVHFQIEVEGEVELTLEKNGPGQVKAGDIKTPAGVTIFNKDEYLGSLADKKSSLEMKIWVESGVGYLAAEERNYSQVGVIPVDSFYNPVRRANYKVDETRVGRATNFDKLTFEVWTTGVVKPREAIEEAAQIAVQFFSQIYNPQESKSVKKGAKTALKSVAEEVVSVEELELPVRVANALIKAGYKNVSDFSGKAKKDLKSIKNLGAKSIDLVAANLQKKGVSLE